MGSKKKNTGRHNPVNKVASNISAPARNLPKNDLGGVIFGCKDHTIRECFSKTLFGLPAPHFAYVKKISPGLPLFLFNYSDRKLHGVFEAAHHGQLNIDPHAWTGGSVELTKYPAQVQFNVKKRCHALTEKQFSPIIANNYYETRHFWFELDRFQTAKLVELFSSSSSVPYDGLHHSHHNILTTLPTSEASTSGQQKTFEQTAWSSLFKDNSTSDMANKFGNLKIASHPNFPSSRQPNEEWNSWTSEERAEKHNIQPLLNILTTPSTSEITTSCRQKAFEQIAWNSPFKDNSTSYMVNKFGYLKTTSHPNFPHQSNLIRNGIHGLQSSRLAGIIFNHCSRFLDHLWVEIIQ
nr:Kelch-like protein [Ipomoea batatas]